MSFYTMALFIIIFTKNNVQQVDVHLPIENQSAVPDLIMHIVHYKIKHVYWKANPVEHSLMALKRLALRSS